jgi:hypothetical protein
MKSCLGCKVEKPLTEFYTQKNPNGRTYHNSYCKPCEKKKDRAYKLKRYATDPEFAERLKGYVRSDRTKKAGRIRGMFASVKASASRRKLPFILIKSDIESRLEVQDWRCARTGILFDLRSGEGRLPFGPAIDRIDTKQGYAPGNIQIVCNVYNFAKMEFTDADVLTMATALIKKSEDDHNLC